MNNMGTNIINSKMAVSISLGMVFAYSMTYVLLGRFVMDPAILFIGAAIGFNYRILRIMVSDFTSREW